MKPFDYKEALSGKLCKTANEMYVLLLADANADSRIYPKPVKPLVGLIFNNTSLCTFRYWDYDGKSSLPEERTDIIGILDEYELGDFNNSKILKEAFDNGKKIIWEDCPFVDSISVVGHINGIFTLSFDGWICTTNGAGMKGLRIVD